MDQQLIDSYENEGYTNKEITNSEVIFSLAQHSISFKFIDTNLMALNDMTRVDETGAVVDCSEWVDTTGWKFFDLLSFLNY